MLKKMLGVLVALVLFVSVSAPVFAQDADAKGAMKAKKEERWEGNVTIISKDKSTIVVRKIGTSVVKTIAWDASTTFRSQEHDKKPNPITSGDIKEGDRVICVGNYDKEGVLHATLISKRLTQHSAM